MAIGDEAARVVLVAVDRGSQDLCRFGQWRERLLTSHSAEAEKVVSPDVRMLGQSVLDEYTRRYQVQSEQATALGVLEARIANGRLWLVVAAGIMAWLAFGQKWFSGWWLLTPLAVFITLIIRHEHVVDRLAES